MRKSISKARITARRNAIAIAVAAAIGTGGPLVTIRVPPLERCHDAVAGSPVMAIRLSACSQMNNTCVSNMQR